MGKINVLSFAVANLIAAGEVVDRPASVIKELMENAIDAGSTRITVEIQNGGVTFMRVSDNGCGMSAEDLPIAVRRHATSKIREAEDLDGILTLGFRGEALAAIASVSHIRIFSKHGNKKHPNNQYYKSYIQPYGFSKHLFCIILFFFYLKNTNWSIFYILSKYLIQLYWRNIFHWHSSFHHFKTHFF